MISIMLEPPAELDGLASFHTNRHSRVKTKWECQGAVEHCHKGAQLAGTVRAILESLQELHCTVEDFHMGANRQWIVPNGVIRAWTTESEELVRRAVGDMRAALEAIQELPLRFEFYIEYSLTQTIVAKVN